MRADSLLKQTLYSACKSDTEGEMCRPVADMSGRLFFAFAPYQLMTQIKSQTSSFSFTLRHSQFETF